MTDTPRTARRPRRGLPAAVVGVLLALTACSSGSGSAGAPTASPSPAVALTMAPADGKTGVAPAAAVTVSTSNATLTQVAVVADSGDTVTGRLAADGRSWRSRGKLSFGVHYTVTATTPDGKKHRAGAFSTAARPGASRSVHTSSVLGDHKTYGVGMPIILRLSQGLADRPTRAAFERTLHVRSTPATTGAWGWVNNREIHFRPQTYWAPRSTVRLTVDSAGRTLGGGYWGRTDMTVDFSIGAHRELIADGVAHRMTVREGGRVVRTIPVSLGRTKYPSSSGVMLIMDKRPKALFDSSTYGLPVDDPEGYRTPVEYAMRLTWGGEFIHAAPWSVGDQGRRNVSHGCINMSTPNAAWLFARVLTGDPVVVRNAGPRVDVGNGWSDWSVTFSQWVERSATGMQTTG